METRIVDMPWGGILKSLPFGPDEVLAVRFTTPQTSSPNRGSILIGEHGGGVFMRTATISETPGDFDNGLLSPVVGNSFQIPFSVGQPIKRVPTLQPGTTYYFNVKNRDEEDRPTCTSGNCPVIIQLRKPLGL